MKYTVIILIATFITSCASNGGYNLRMPSNQAKGDYSNYSFGTETKIPKQTKAKSSTTFHNSRYKITSQEQGRILFNRDFSVCKQLAYKSVPMPRSTGRSTYAPPPKPRSYGIYNSWGNKVGTLKPERSYGVSAPSLMPMIAGMEAARNSPNNIYRSTVRRFATSCMDQKGWRQIPAK